MTTGVQDLRTLETALNAFHLRNLLAERPSLNVFAVEQRGKVYILTRLSIGTMSSGKQIKTTLRLLIKAGQAKPTPPIGPALGQAGLNIMSFCKDFNAKTAHFQVGRPSQRE